MTLIGRRASGPPSASRHQNLLNAVAHISDRSRCALSAWKHRRMLKVLTVWQATGLPTLIGSMGNRLCFFYFCFLTLANFWQTLRGPFSALSMPIFASKYSFELAWKLLARSTRFTHFCTSGSLESYIKTMKSASGKRPPDEAHGSGDETIRPQRSSDQHLLDRFSIFLGFRNEYFWNL